MPIQTTRGFYYDRKWGSSKESLYGLGFREPYFDSALSNIPSPPLVNPVAKVLLEGMLDPKKKSPLSALSICPNLLATIFALVRKGWAVDLKLGYDDRQISSWGIKHYIGNEPDDVSAIALSLTGRVEFPKPRGIVCNMMPFILGKNKTIPKEYRAYVPLIDACAVEEEQNGKVCYLTIHESRALKAEPQRRPGIHVDGFLGADVACKNIPAWHHWGMGWSGMFTGGIYMASNVTGSCRMWNVQLPRWRSNALGRGCDCEHLRGVLNENVHPVESKAGYLYWMTDATPHESLPLEVGTYRQYFRLVTSEVGVWWEKHSTKNPLGIEPACTVLTYDKFTGEE